jgi:hypothetical protein
VRAATPHVARSGRALGGVRAGALAGTGVLATSRRPPLAGTGVLATSRRPPRRPAWRLLAGLAAANR